MSVDVNCRDLMDINGSIRRSVAYAKSVLISSKADPFSPLDLRNKEQKKDALIGNPNIKIKSFQPKDTTINKIKEVKVPNILDLEERIYLSFVKHNIHPYDSEHKSVTEQARVKFIKDLYYRYIQTEAYWSDYYKKASNYGAMDDLYLRLLQETISPKIDDISPYISILIDIDEMLYFKLPGSLKHPTWDMWDIVQQGKFNLLFVNTGDYRIHQFTQNALNDPSNEFYGKFNKEELSSD